MRQDDERQWAAKIFEENARLARRVEELMRENAHLRDLAHSDSLTGLANRRAFSAQLERAVRQALRYGRALSLLVIDLDEMKQINDRLGHAAGDRALQVTASAIQQTVRASDFAARLGGDEFAVILPETPLRGARRLAERIGARLEETCGRSFPVRASIGAAELAGEGAPRDATALLHAADEALYRTKTTRRGAGRRTRNLAEVRV